MLTELPTTFASDIAGVIDQAVMPLQKRIKSLEENINRLLLLHAKVAELEQKPALAFCGVWKDGERYGEGSLVQRSGLWLAEQATRRKPGDASSNWRLIVKERS